MRVLAAAILGLLLGSLALMRCGEQDNSARQAAVQSNNAFSTALYKTLSSDAGNLIVSPLSAEVVLAMIWLGAGGDTASQLTAGLHLPDDHSKVKTGFRTLLSSLQSNETFTLQVANKLYIQEGFDIKDNYRQIVVDDFHSDAEVVDFSNNTEAVRVRINQWVEEKTQNKIKDLIEKEGLSENTMLILVNAIYFSGSWRLPFDESRTWLEPFNLTSNSSVNVSMMHQAHIFRYGNIPELKAKAVQLLYQGREYDFRGNDATKGISMLLLLPDKVDGLASLEAKLETTNVTQIINSLWPHAVILSLPRFKLEKTLNMKVVLENMGITSLFTTEADLSGITNRSIHVDSVTQKTFIEVTENGTEAAATTDSVMVTRSGTTPYEFKVNHPFLFLILDNPTGTILFIGRVIDPSL